MLKKITVEQLRVGVHIHEFCGSWMDHSFWRTRFTLSNADELARIRSSGVQEVVIDTEKGLDVDTLAAAAPAVPVTEPQAAPSTRRAPPPRNAAALAEAAVLYRKSVPQIKNLFGEARLGHAIGTENFVPLVDNITDSVLRNPVALISVARLKQRDDYTYMHSVAVCALMVSLARQLGMEGEQIRLAGMAGMMHDLGKAVMPLDVLNKPGKLTDDEYAIMKAHPERGHEMLLEDGNAGPVVLDVCLHHHEKIDGTGYPHRLKGSDISLFAKMGAVCDVYDAVTSVRPYKDGWDPAEALRRMAQWAGHFEPAVFQAFIKTVGIYPVGSLVRLQSTRLAVVTEQHPESLLTPKVKVFFSTRANLRMEPEELDLGNPRCQDKIVGCEPPEKWGFKGLDLLWQPAA